MLTCLAFVLLFNKRSPSPLTATASEMLSPWLISTRLESTPASPKSSTNNWKLTWPKLPMLHLNPERRREPSRTSVLKTSSKCLWSNLPPMDNTSTTSISSECTAHMKDALAALLSLMQAFLLTLSPLLTLHAMVSSNQLISNLKFTSPISLRFRNSNDESQNSC